MRGGENAHFIDLFDNVTGYRVDIVQRVDIIAEKLNAHRALLVRRNDIDRIALDAEGTAGKAHIVALILDIY